MDKQQPKTIRVTCDSCRQTFEIRKSNHPESYPCPRCKINNVLRLAD